MVVKESKRNVLVDERIRDLYAERKGQFEARASEMGFGVEFGVEETATLISFSASMIYAKLSKPDANDIVMLRPINPRYSSRLRFNSKRLAEYSVRMEMADENIPMEDVEHILRNL